MSASTKRLRRKVFARADGACEACGAFITEESGHLDHFFGRAKVPEALSNCWLLCIACDVERTNPAKTDAAYWWGLFILHAQRYGYETEALLADSKIEALRAKGLAP